MIDILSRKNLTDSSSMVHKKTMLVKRNSGFRGLAEQDVLLS